MHILQVWNIIQDLGTLSSKESSVGIKTSLLYSLWRQIVKNYRGLQDIFETGVMQ